MKNHEFYRKYKTTYPPVSKFSREDWWQLIVISLAAILVAPLIVYKNDHHNPFTQSYYLQQIKYFLLVGIPYAMYYFWTRWLQRVKRNRGYGWVGKFEVIRKRSSILFCYLVLAPGTANRLKVSRSLFDSIREGDFVMIYKDALGKIERVTRVKDFAARLSRGKVKE